MPRQLLATSNGGDFVLANPGPTAATCIDVIDMGLMDGMYGPKHKIRLVFITPQAKEDGTPISISQMYNFSLHEKSKLGQHLVSWRGAPFTQEEKSQGFDIEKLVGSAAFINIVHSTKGENTYANIDSIMRLPQGMQAPGIPPDYIRELDRNPSRDVGSPYYKPSDNQLSPAAVAPAQPVQNGFQQQPQQSQQMINQAVQQHTQTPSQSVQQAPNNGHHTQNLYSNGFPDPALQQAPQAQPQPVDDGSDLPF